VLPRCAQLGINQAALVGNLRKKKAGVLGEFSGPLEFPRQQVRRRGCAFRWKLCLNGTAQNGNLCQVDGARAVSTSLVKSSAGLTRKPLVPNVRDWQVQRSSSRC